MSLMSQMTARFSNMIARGRITDKGGSTGDARILAEEAQSDVFIQRPMGIASNLGERDALILSLLGNSTARVAQMVDPEPPAMGEGEMGFYHPDNPGSMVRFKEDGAVAIEVDGNVMLTIGSDGSIAISADPEKITIGGKRVARVGDRTTKGGTII